MSVGAVSLDAAGTLLHPAEPVADCYARFARSFGGTRCADEIRGAFAAAMRMGLPLRTGDPSWRAYWARVVGAATGCADARLLDALYRHYAAPSAWRVADDARACIVALRSAGLRVGVLSNWDTRLRPLLDGLGLLPVLDAVVVSGECGFEKPDARIFAHAAACLGVEPVALLHVGDDVAADVAGAVAAGCQALNIDGVGGFTALAARMLG